MKDVKYSRGALLTNEKTFAEFFAGIGLVNMGLQRGGWNCIYGNDINEKKCAMYEGHFGISPHYHVEDIWQTESVLEHLTSEPFLATASFPCIDLSLAGHWRGFEGDHSSTYFGFLKVLEGLRGRRPKLVMLENVYGFLTSHHGKDFQRAVRELSALGYWIDAFVLDAKRFVPQSRPRTFVFGFHESLRPHLVERRPRFSLGCEWDDSIRQSASMRPQVLRTAIDEVSLSTGWATLPFSPPRQNEYSLTNCLDLDDGQDWWDVKETLKHYAMMEPPSRARVDTLVRSKETTAGTAFRRTRRGATRTEVRFDIAGCLRTPKGGSAKQIVVAVVKGSLRMRWMSPLEYARLQGAGDFRISVPTTQALYGFGDAVCVPAIEWIDDTILTPLYEASVLSDAAV